MARKRKTVAEKRQERDELDRKAWEQFRPALEAVRSAADLTELLTRIPRPDSPGRKHFTNLLWFVNTLSVPGGSSPEERTLYLQLVDKLEKVGELEPEARKRAEALLLAARREQTGW